MSNPYVSRSPLRALAVFALKKLTRPYARYKVLGGGRPWHSVHWA